MAEPDPRPEFDQSSGLGRSGRVPGDTESLGRLPQQDHVTDGLDRCEEEESSGVDRKGLKLSKKLLFHATGQRHRARQSESERQLRGRAPPG